MTRTQLRRLSLQREIIRSQARVARLAEEGAVLRASFDQADLRMLIAETPLADRDRATALARLRGAERELARLKGNLRHLEREWAGLGPGAETVPGPRP